MRLDVPALAVGKWRGILPALGVDARWLSKKNGPCPVCQAGKDRYRFTDHEGRGMWICSHCGAGDGFSLLMHLKGWDFKTAAAEVNAIVGSVEISSAKPRGTEEQKAACRKLWRQSVPITLENASGRYLHRRLGVTDFPACLRHVERLRYEEDVRLASWHPAMLALVTDALGKPVSLHRTYLTDDWRKADVPSPKKAMRGALPRGSAIRLGAITDGALGIAEGIETALAAGARFSVPVWSAISADGMAQWLCPPEVTSLTIAGDNDDSFTGQWAAYACARLHRTRRPEVTISVEIPPESGTDWADFANLTSKGSRIQPNPSTPAPSLLRGKRS
jgi:putative DNA primase/helicase